MYQEISQLLMYGDLEEDSILYQMGEIFAKYETGEYNKTGLVRDINVQVKRILVIVPQITDLMTICGTIT